jgi:hypothetical protein
MKDSGFVPVGLSVGRKMFLSVVASGEACSAVDSTPPQIRLRADNGLPVRVIKAPDLVDIANDQTVPVASASWDTADTGIFLVVVSIDKPTSLWEVEITNNHSEERKFTWTVANTLEEVRQPWIDMPTSLDLGTVSLEHRPTGGAAAVINRGSKPLTVIDAEVFSGGPFFELTNFTDEIDPHRCGEVDLSLDPLADIPPSDDVYEAEVHVQSDASNGQPAGFRSLLVRATRSD